MELREQIKGTIHFLSEERIDQILSLFKQEIEKVESSHRRLDNGYYVGFEECRQKILAMLEEK